MYNCHWSEVERRSGGWVEVSGQKSEPQPGYILASPKMLKCLPIPQDSSLQRQAGDSQEGWLPACPPLPPCRKPKGLNQFRRFILPRLGRHL